MDKDLGKWSKEILDAVKDNPGLSEQCKTLAQQAFGSAGEYGKNVSKHIVGFSEFGKLYLSKALQKVGGIEIKTISFLDTAGAVIGTSLRNTLVSPLIVIMPRVFLENLPFGEPKEFRA